VAHFTEDDLFSSYAPAGEGVSLGENGIHLPALETVILRLGIPRTQDSTWDQKAPLTHNTSEPGRVHRVHYDIIIVRLYINAPGVHRAGAQFL
jgi:hypothetical protein